MAESESDIANPGIDENGSLKAAGHIAYDGVTDNSDGIGRFLHEVMRSLFKWLNRRGKRGCMSREKFRKLLKRFPMPKPRITVNLFETK